MKNVGGGSNAAHDRDDGTTDAGPPGPSDRRPDEPELQRLLPAAAGGDRRALEEFLRELQPHVVRLEARPASLEGRGEVTIRRLVRNAARRRSTSRAW